VNLFKKGFVLSSRYSRRYKSSLLNQQVAILQLIDKVFVISWPGVRLSPPAPDYQGFPCFPYFLGGDFAYWLGWYATNNSCNILLVVDKIAHKFVGTP
jgi:hypothetical protein